MILECTVLNYFKLYVLSVLSIIIVNGVVLKIL